ncbi:MAG: DUF1549 and DUF1553 domain-containing protein [Planctomycetota bacterium]|nr:DUF1549 and DUF1553 domain-containing protein [Planctomycetota bacterium]
MKIAKWLSFSLLALIACAAQGNAEESNIPVSNLRIESSASLLKEIEKNKILFRGSDARYQCLVTGNDANGNEIDLTRKAIFRFEPAGIASIDPFGQVAPLQNGTTILTAQIEGVGATNLIIEVTNWDENPEVNFPNQVVPIFTKLGCNGGGCHGKAAGQNGFKLSLLGFEAGEDYEHLVKESRGRRLSTALPDSSLLLTKAINAVPHGGGQRLEMDSQEYRVLRRWISQGLKPGKADDRRVVSISVSPQLRRMLPQQDQQLSVTASYSDGTTEDVTPSVQFESNDADMADVDKRGLVSMKSLAGEVAVMARFQGQVAVFRASVPIVGGTNEWPEPTNPIDSAVIAQLRSLNIPMSRVCDEPTFLRRATLDIAGRLPTIAEVENYGQDNSLDKRAKLIDRLLASDDYADHFANKWMLILRNRRETPGQKSGTFAFHRWIRDQIAGNRPFDQFVRDIVAASGSIDIHPPVVWYRQVPDNFSRLEDTAQLFLGQRIQCARCHHHPYEKWAQKDYFQMAAFFSQVKTKAGLSPDEAILYAGSGQPRSSHPKTGEALKPAGLDGPSRADSDVRDPREYLVDWMVDKNNPFFAKSISNRYWKHFFGRGLVEPEDDMRVTNPPSNSPLLDALATQLVDSNYDTKGLIRAICNSRVYQLDSEPNGENLRDRKCYSRNYPKRLSAEQILDAVDQVTQTATSFEAMPDRTKAIALPDSSFRSYFLTVFGRPDATTACECERANDSTLAQSLHFANSKELIAKLAEANGLPTSLANRTTTHEERLQELYLRAFSRKPSDSEIKPAIAYIDRKADKLEAYQDLTWALLNCKEFLFNH